MKNKNLKNENIKARVSLLIFWLFYILRRKILMKRKKYKVKVKLIFETAMDHEQTSMKRAEADVNRVLTDYLKGKKMNILNLFNDPPRIIYKVEKINEEL